MAIQRRAQDGRVGGIRLLAQQFEVLLQKNVILAMRNKVAFIVQILATFLFILLIFGIDRALRANNARLTINSNYPNPVRDMVTAIPDCASQLYILEPCLTIIYAPNTSAVVDAIMNMTLNDNNPPIPRSRVKAFANSFDMDNYLIQNKQTVSAAVEFFPRFANDSSLEGVDFGLQMNGTVKFVRGVFEDPNFFNLMPVQVAVERSIARYFYALRTGNSPRSLQWEISTSEFAHPAKDPFSFVGIIAPTFLLAAAMFTFVVQVSNVVLERETKLRESMRVMGLYDSMFWLSWLAWECIVVNFISSLTIVICGLIFQFDLFLKNDFGVLIFLFWFFELAMTGLGYFLSTFVSKASGATFMGFIIFLFGFIIMLVVNVGQIPYSDVIDAPWLEYIFAMFPPALLAKGILDLGQATATDQRPGIAWSERDSYCKDSLYTVNCKWSLYEMYNWLLLDFGVYMVLCIYFDNINANEYGVRKPFYFFLMPSYWFGAKAKNENIEQIEAAGAKAGSEVPEGLDTDVMAEEASIKDRLRGGHAGLENGVALELHGLVKTFYGRGAPFHAVRGNWFRVETGKLFALLGPNGAGKTTTINCLTGVLPTTAGNAVIYGQSVAGGGMGKIRSFMGVCPQFDMLWGELTGREHLRIFAGIKGLPRSQWVTVASDLLDHTKLTSAADRRSSGYSGGMKRRLSVAVALIGDPAIVFLDEPTTGMDPITRRYVWDIILAAKPGRAIVLTTHSMEEADVLSDNIAIIAKGRLRCFGSSLRLKSKFGAGFRLAVSVMPQGAAGHSHAALDNYTEEAIVEKRKRMNQFFRDRLGLAPYDEGRAYTTFIIPREMEDKLSGFLDALKGAKDQLGITDTQMSLTTLEEVFLTIARKAEQQAAAAANRTGIVNVTADGQTFGVVVPWGCDKVQLPNTGEIVEVFWVQDDEGRLVYSHHMFRGQKQMSFQDTDGGKKGCCKCC